MRTYTLLYDDEEIAVVSVSPDEDTQLRIREMVEFWAFWEKRLAEAGGDYTKCWLKQLARYVLYNGKVPPDDEEGWYPLDGSMGVKVKRVFGWTFDEDLIDSRLDEAQS